MGERERKVFDLFIVATIVVRVRRGESELMLLADEDEERGMMEKDLVGVLWPRARVEDLVLLIGRGEGWISIAEEGDGDGYREEDVTVELGMKTAKVMLPFRSQGGGGNVVKKGVVELARSRDETLENLAQRLAREMKRVRVRVVEGGSKGKERAKGRAYEWI